MLERFIIVASQSQMLDLQLVCPLVGGPCLCRVLPQDIRPTAFLPISLSVSLLVCVSCIPLRAEQFSYTTVSKLCFPPKVNMVIVHMRSWLSLLAVKLDLAIKPSSSQLHPALLDSLAWHYHVLYRPNYYSHLWHHYCVTRHNTPSPVKDW